MPVAPSTPGRVLLLSFISVAHRRVVVRRCAVVPCSAIVLLRAFAFCRAVRNRARLLFRAVPSVVRRVVMSRCAVVVSRRAATPCAVVSCLFLADERLSEEERRRAETDALRQKLTRVERKNTEVTGIWDAIARVVPLHL